MQISKKTECLSSMYVPANVSTTREGQPQEYSNLIHLYLTSKFILCLRFLLIFHGKFFREGSRANCKRGICSLGSYCLMEINCVWTIHVNTEQ